MANAEEGKLTKQQKRDLRRNSKKGGDDHFSASTRRVAKEEGSSVYKRTVIYPSIFNAKNTPRGRFVTISDNCFQALMKSSYNGFTVDDRDQFPKEFILKFNKALSELDSSGYYQFDVTQPTGLGTKLAKTFVTRCLVGDSGITYKYLGLRMFSFPWNRGEVGVSEALAAIGDLNRALSERTKHHLSLLKKDEVGSCDYNLTLINRCFPDSVVKLKDEPLFHKEKCTVSWHADSSLEHYSSIAVYHTTTTPVGAECVGDESWRVALKVQNNAEGPLAGKLKISAANASVHDEQAMNLTRPDTPDSSKKGKSGSNDHVIPAVAIPLASGSVYYLLDDFNHHHQHSVLAGTTDRYASTHRVSRQDGHTLWSIRSKCLSALQGSGLSLKQLKSEQIALTDLEFEWFRQFYIQGEQHHRKHLWWHEPLKELWRLWIRLMFRYEMTIQALSDAADLDGDRTTADSFQSTILPEALSSKAMEKRYNRAAAVSLPLYDAMIEFLSERHQKREGWRERSKDELFRTLPPEQRPMAVPFPVLSADNREGTNAWAIGKDMFCKSNQRELAELIERLRGWKSRVEARLSSNGNAAVKDLSRKKRKAKKDVADRKTHLKKNKLE